MFDRRAARLQEQGLAVGMCRQQGHRSPAATRPSASVRQFIEFAVNMPEHEPQVGHAERSVHVVDFVVGDNCVAGLIIASMRSTAMVLPPFHLAGLHRPARDETAGMFRRIAAISMPGVILSQLEMQTMASAQWR